MEQIGECDEKTDYIDRAKGLLEENVEESRIEEIDLMTFLYNIDFSRWNRQDLEKSGEFNLVSEQRAELSAGEKAIETTVVVK